MSVTQGAVVVRGVVREYVRMAGRGRPVAMKVEVRETLRGEFRAKKITVIGDFGMSCIPYVSNFPIGTEWIMVVHGPIEVEGLGDENFRPPDCATAFLRVQDGMVKGAVRGSREPITLGELRTMLKGATGKNGG